MPTARGGVAGAVFDGLFVVAGGEQLSGTFTEVEAFDPVANHWLSLPSLPTPRHGLAAAAVGNTLYIIGGGKKPGLSVSGSNEALEVR
jgi:N-acetylneuraminic acid mutarotase